MYSLRQQMTCIGLAGSGRLYHDYFGYRSSVGPVSLRRQARLLAGKHIHLNLIQVGIDQFLPSDRQALDSALRYMRDAYSGADIGIGRALRYGIATGDARGREHIGSEDEADDLTDEWSVNNDGIDTFFVLTYNVFKSGGKVIGSAPVDGPCDKEDKGSGAVVEVRSAFVGATLSHEIGHYLGLDHPSADNANAEQLMYFDTSAGTVITNAQRSTMGTHCSMRAPCP